MYIMLNKFKLTNKKNNNMTKKKKKNEILEVQRIQKISKMFLTLFVNVSVHLAWKKT